MSRWLQAVGLAGALGAAPAAFLPPPLGWQEPSPVARLFLQLPFEAPEVLPAGQVGAEARLLYSNSLLRAERPGLTLLADVETAQPTLQLAAGLGRGLELQAALPFVADWGGVLDRPVEAVDGAFGATNPDRQARPRDRAAWVLAGDDGRGVSRSGPGAGLGDAWLALKAGIVQEAGARPAISARVALSLPSGRLPWGAGGLEPAAGLLAGWRWERLALRLTADVAFPTRPLRTVDLPTRPYAALQAGLALSLGDSLALHAQASAHTPPLRSTGFAQLDHPTAYVLLGLSRRLGRTLTLDLGVAENVFSPYRGADISFLASVARR